MFVLDREETKGEHDDPVIDQCLEEMMMLKELYEMAADAAVFLGLISLVLFMTVVLPGSGGI